MSFIVTCIFTVLYFFRPFEVVNSLIGLPILFIVGVIAGVLLGFEILTGKIKLFTNGTDQMMIGLYIAIVLSHLSHSYFGGAIQSINEFFPVFISYFIIAHTINTEQKLKLFLLLLISCAAFLAFEGILEVSNGESYFGVKALEQGVGYNDDGSRIFVQRIKWVGPFADPNDLAMVFVFAVPILLDLLLKRIIFFPLITLGLILYGLYLTNSRGGMLSLLVSLFVFFVLRYKSVKGMTIGLCLGAVLMIFGPSRMGEMSASEDSAHGRLDAWYNGYQMFQSSPLFGVGKGMFTDFYTLTAHNSFVLVISELGLLGAIFFVGCFYYPLVNGYNTIFRSKSSCTDMNLLSIHNALLSSLMGLIISMFFLSRSYVLLPYMCVALLMFFTRLVDNKVGEASYFNIAEIGIKHNLIKITKIVIIGIVFVYFMIKVLI